jgi:hypothetical protein
MAIAHDTLCRLKDAAGVMLNHALVHRPHNTETGVCSTQQMLPKLTSKSFDV